MLSISKLHVSICDKPTLNGLTLELPAGEVHAKAGLRRGIIEKSGLISLSRTF